MVGLEALPWLGGLASVGKRVWKVKAGGGALAQHTAQSLDGPGQSRGRSTPAFSYVWRPQITSAS